MCDDAVLEHDMKGTAHVVTAEGTNLRSFCINNLHRFLLTVAQSFFLKLLTVEIDIRNNVLELLNQTMYITLSRNIGLMVLTLTLAPNLLPNSFFLFQWFYFKFLQLYSQ